MLAVAPAVASASSWGSVSPARRGQVFEAPVGLVVTGTVGGAKSGLAQEGVGRERDDARGTGGSDFAQVRPEKRGLDHEVHGDEVLAAGER